MEITLTQLGKRFQREWIFKDLSLSIPAGSRIAVIGPNGSGKSTLLKVVSGAVPATQGEIHYRHNGQVLALELAYKQLSFAAPYLELIDAFSLREMLEFHFTFKQKRFSLSIQEMAEKMMLENAINKPIRFFSSGMRQRLKLGLCFFSAGSLLLLDEPTTNLDTRGSAWYLQLIDEMPADLSILVASNQENEYRFCKEKINILDYKTT